MVTSAVHTARVVYLELLRCLGRGGCLNDRSLASVRILVVQILLVALNAVIVNCGPSFGALILALGLLMDHG